MRRVAALSCLVLNVALCIAAAADMPAAISLPLAIPVLLFAPGMAWSIASANDDLERDLGTWLALSIGLSVSLDILVGLVVYVLGIPITALSMSIGLLVVDLPLLAITGTTALPRGIASARPKATLMALSWIVVSLIGVALAAVAITNSSHAASAHNFGGYTVFAVGPPSRTPTDRLRVEITNHEGRALSYVLTSGSGPVQRLPARTRGLSAPIHLAAGASVIVAIPGRARNGCTWVSLYEVGQGQELGSLCVSPME
jgi:hypothetical protein